MKNFTLLAALAITSLSCQREEEREAGTPPPPGSRSDRAASYRPAGSTDENTAALPAKSGERPPKGEKKIWVAEPVADQPGYVTSPFSGKIIDVKGLPAGLLVADPTFPAEEQKYFRVPEFPEEELKKRNAPAGRMVPGKQGFIFSPHNNKIIDARGIEPGAVILDPAAPAGETLYIKIPGAPPPKTDSLDEP